MARQKHMITVEEKVWNEAKSIIHDELNLNMSKFIEIQLRALSRSQTVSQRDLYEGVAEDLFLALEKRKKAAASPPNQGSSRKVRGRPKKI